MRCAFTRHSRRSISSSDDATFWGYTGTNLVPEHRCQLFGRLADRAQQACGDAETGAGMGAATGASNHALQTYRRTSTAGKVSPSRRRST